MRNYPDSAAAEARVTYGDDLVVGLDLFDETKGLGATLAGFNDAMYEKVLALLGLDRALARTRPVVRNAELRIEEAVRKLFNDCKNADGGKAGAVTATVFPNGLDAEVRPKGTSQTEAVQKLATRLSLASAPEVKEVAQTWTPRIAEALGRLDEAVTNRTKAEAAVATAYAAIQADGAAHRLEVDRLMGAVRAAFPQNRSRQNAVFPLPPRPRKKSPAAPSAPPA